MGVRVAGTLETSWDDMVEAAMGLATQAAELRAELDAIGREWDHVSGEWRGDASASYGNLESRRSDSGPSSRPRLHRWAWS